MIQQLHLIRCGQTCPITEQKYNTKCFSIRPRIDRALAEDLMHYILDFRSLVRKTLRSFSSCTHCTLTLLVPSVM